MINYFRLLKHPKVNLHARSFDGQSAVLRAAYNGQFKSLQFLKKYTNLRFDLLDQDANLPLHYSAVSFKINCMRYLIRVMQEENQFEPDFILNIKNKYDQSPLSIMTINFTKIND